MLAMMHAHLSTGRYGDSLLPFVLSNLVKSLQGDFCRFADCGAGIGWTSQEYAELLGKQLSDDVKARALVACYEPLPENFVQMRKNLVGDIYTLHQQAVSDVAGTAVFYVPVRMGSGNRLWTEGTSYGGTLTTFSSKESISVETVRLQDAYAKPFDFIKLDLQGGEMKALEGVGTMLDEVKLLYVETQLLSPAASTDFLNRKGFITFFDGLQFGLVDGAEEVPFSLLESLGIEITRARVPTPDGFPLILWGRFKPNADLFDAETLSFKSEIADKLVSAGVSYMQTDTFAFKPSILQLLTRHLL